MRRLIPYNYAFFLKIFIIDILFLALARGLFYYKFSYNFPDVPWQELLKAFLIGAKMDCSLLAYLIAPFFLIGIIPILGVEFSRISRFFLGYLPSIIFVAVLALTLIDIEFFAEYNSHLNLTAIEYLNSNLDVIWDMIWSNYPVLKYVGGFLLVALVYLFIIRLIIKKKPEKMKWSLKNLLKRFVFFLIFAGGLFLAARGSIGTSQMDWGQAFFSNNNMVNQLTLNPVYNLYRNIYYAEKVAKENFQEKISYFGSNKEAISFVKKNITQGGYLDENFPFYKQVTSSKKEKKLNVVLIILEEFSAELTGATGYNKNLTPNFDALAKKGVLFTQFFSCGQRTNKGISSILCSWPPLVGKSMMSQTEGQQKISTLASVLKDKNYQTWFCYGGDAQYDNMKGFLITKGFDNFISQDDFDRSDFISKWGVADELVFNKIIEKADVAHSKNKPFLFTMMSLTNHPPYTVPHYAFGEILDGGDLNGNYNTFKYVDWCIGQFITKMKKKPYFKNTLFVFVGDHSKTFHHDLPFDYRKSFVPALFYSPKHLSPKRVTYIANQMDIAPTILGILNMDYKASFWGKDLLKNSNTKNYAVIVRNSNFGYLQDGYYLTGKFGNKNSNLYTLWENEEINNRPKLKEKLLEKVHAIEQGAYSLYKEKRITPQD